MKRIVAAAGASMLLLLGGCGGGGDDEVAALGAEGTAGATGVPSGAAGGTSLAGSADADTPDTDLGDPNPGAPSENKPEVVKPRAGMDHVHQVAWESATATGKRVVRVQFYGGVEPCDVLDSVKVSYTAKAVKIGLFSGSDPAKPDTMCIEIAKLKAVDVQLNSDLDGRKIVDTSPDAVKSDPGNTDPETDGGTPAPAGKIRGDAPAVELTPKPGQENLRTISFTDTQAIDPDTLRINFMSGVEPCEVLDHVKVVETTTSVTVTLYVGNAPGKGDTACPALARFAYTDIDLGSALGNREIVDGSTA
jgi:hypothetical protein